MTPTLETLEKAYSVHRFPDWVTSFPGSLKDRRDLLSALSRHIDEVRPWAEGERDLRRLPHNRRAYEIEQKLGNVLGELVADYAELGITVDPRLAHLEDAWDQASDRLHRHGRDEDLLGDKPPQDMTGMIEYSAQSDDPLIETGKRIRSNLETAKELDFRARAARQEANNINVYSADAAYVAKLQEFEAQGLVMNPLEDSRPRLPPDLAQRLLSAGILEPTRSAF